MKLPRTDIPKSISDLPPLPESADEGDYHPSPDDWADEFVYFLLPDRFDDGGCDGRPPFDHASADRTAPAKSAFKTPYWNYWAISGRNRFQGGTIKGIEGRLCYLEKLGVTTIWLAPVWRQRANGVDANACGDGSDDPFYPPKQKDVNPRAEDVDFRKVQTPRDDYHGYAIAHFLDVDSRFGTVQDLCDLIEAAHHKEIRVVLDIVINHATECFAYDVAGALNPLRPRFLPNQPADSPYPFGGWLDVDNRAMPRSARPATFDEGVWPTELQDKGCFSRRGLGDYGNGDFLAAGAEFRVADYRNRDFRYPLEPAKSHVLDAMTAIYKYWIALTDCDGFRVDTFKHVPVWVGKEFVRQICDYAATLGKKNFLVMGEIGGSDAQAATYLELERLMLLELGARRQSLRELANGDGTRAAAVLTPTVAGVAGQLDSKDPVLPLLGGITDEDLRKRVVMSVDDHDGLGIDRLRRLAGRYDAAAVIPAATFLLFGPGVPCLYYGTEQALTGPPGDNLDLYDYGWDTLDPNDTDKAHHEQVRRQGGDRYLREAMFGPTFPRRAGITGRKPLATSDVTLPGFGPRGTSGLHAFNMGSPWYVSIAALAALRKESKALRSGRITRLTKGRIDGGRYGVDLPDDIVVWAREDQSSQDFGIIVCCVGRPGGAVPHAIEVELPARLGGATIERRLDLIGEARPSTMRTNITVHRRPSGLAYLLVGNLAPEQIQVHLGQR